MALRPSPPTRGKTGPRLLVIGLDSADAALIERWCQEGYLPTLQALRQQGTWGRLGTTAEVMHVSAWPSLYTGTTPGKHGMYHAYQIRAGEQDVHRTRADECAQPPFWKFLDDAGRRCIVMDAFMNYPLEGFRGIQILEYGTWTWFAEPLATPNGVWKEIISKFGHYPAPEHTKVLTRPEPSRFRDQLIAGATVKGKVVRWLMQEKPWDMFFVTFGEPHPAGHYLWHLEDTSYPAHPAEEVRGLTHAVRDVYAAVDAAIGDILRDLDDAVTVIVTSGDGMGPNYAGCHLMPEILHRLGMFYAASVGHTSSSNTAAGTSARPKKSALSTIRDTIPLSVRRAVSRCLPRHLQHQLSMKWTNANIDWTRTKAFCLPNANEGYVRLNLQGREPQGIVERGKVYEELLAELQAYFRELVNPQNGRIAAQQVVCTDTVFPGEQRQHLPDIVVNWDIETRVLADLASERCGLVSKAAGYETAPYYTGNHRPAAFVLARGPQIAEHDVLTGGHIVDIAPTILTMLGVDPPRHLDGRVWHTFLGQPSRPLEPVETARRLSESGRGTEKDTRL
jgi:predicted AlkP superfamily phosphohydrolase/phosphomutase